MCRWMLARAVGWEHNMRWARGRVPAWVWTAAQLGTRLLAALALGALAGPYADLGLRVPADSAFRFSMAVLLLPALAVLLLVTLPRRRWLTAGIGAFTLVVAAGAITGFITADPYAGWFPLLTVAQWLALLLVPVAAGFVLGGPGPNGQIIGMGAWAGLAAWLGVGAHHLVLAARAGAFADTGPSGALGTPLLLFLLVLFVVELPASALGGLLGGAVRVWVGRMAVRQRPAVPVPAIGQLVPAAAAASSAIGAPVTAPPELVALPTADEPLSQDEQEREPVASEVAAILPLPTALPTSAAEPVAHDALHDGGDDAPTPLIA
jgi:hypothetical protein